MTNGIAGVRPAAIEIHWPLMAFVAGYIATLPVWWPPLFGIPGLKAVVVAADVAFLALLAVVLGTSAQRLRPIRKDAAVVSLVPVVGLAVAGLATGDGAATLPHILRTVYSMCVFLLFVHLRLSAEETVVVAWTWVTVAVLVCAVGLAGFLGVTLLGLPPNPLAFPNSWNLGDGFVRLSATLGSSALIHYVMVTVILGLLLLGRGASSPRQRRWLRGAVLALLAVSLFTFSRGIIGLVLALALVGYVSRERIPALWRARHALAAAAGLLVVGGVVATTLALFPLRARVDRDAETLRVEVNVQKNAYYVLHAAALRMFAAHPLTGVGPSRFGSTLTRVTTVEERASAWPPVTDAIDWDPHSTWLGWAARGGVIALTGWMALYAWVLAQLLRRRPSDDPFSARQLAGLALVGILLNGFHVEITQLKFVWTLLGIGVAARR